jgi:histidine ammonia-lyase
MFNYGTDTLTVQKAMDISSGKWQALLSADAVNRIKHSRRCVEKMAQSTKAVYGINTGFGPLCDTQISPADTHKLQENLLLTHAVGVGKPIAPILAKLMMITKVQALSQGYSGIRFEIIERICFFIDNNLFPLVPEQGSVGASGDLAPLSHLFLPIIGEGSFWDGKTEIPTEEVLKEYNLAPIKLAEKEGLALINGTQFILAHAILGLSKMGYLLDLADISGAMSLEGLQGSAAPFREELHRIRPFIGSLIVAKRMRSLLEDSANLADHANCSRVQDPYSIRCIPQVHGASRNAWQHLKELTDIEMNSVTDNPIILNEEEAISGGNFHGQPLAMALDYASVAASELGNIADRRCYLLLEGKYGLPRLLTTAGGLNSGFMIPQYTTAALVSENKSLCFPSSADSIPTSLGQEDHVSMGSISGRKFNQILGNLDKILAIELLYSAQALEYRRPNTFSQLIEGIFAKVREKVPMLHEDRLLKTDINHLVTMVENQVFKVNEGSEYDV